MESRSEASLLFVLVVAQELREDLVVVPGDHHRSVQTSGKTDKSFFQTVKDRRSLCYL